ncbi:MAG: DMT family transporter [Dehalococcoidia bacterium]|nr:DMT family transporter [Dehalococcoidia bacterium]
MIGILFALCAALCYGASTVVIGKAIAHAGPLVVAFVSLVAGLTLVGTVTLVVAVVEPAAAKVSLSGLPWIVVGAVLMFGVGRLAYYRSIEQIGPSRSAALSSTTTLAAPAIGFLFLGDRLSLLTSLGILVTFAGILTLVSGRSR